MLVYKIDAHGHPEITVEKYLADMDNAGISRACLLNFENPWDENYLSSKVSSPSFLYDNAPIPFAHCLKYYEKAPERFILGYCPDPREADAIYKMKAAVDTYGVKICGEVKFRMMYDNPDAVDLFRFCGERGIPVVLHIEYAYANIANPNCLRRHYWYGGDVFTLERLLELCPETNFFGHATGFWDCISGDEDWKTRAYGKDAVIPGGHVERLLEKFPNLYCDCSADSGYMALSRDKNYAKKLMETYPDRFVYGRDGLGNRLSEMIDELEMSDEILEGFYHKNIEKLLGI